LLQAACYEAFFVVCMVGGSGGVVVVAAISRFLVYFIDRGLFSGFLAATTGCGCPRVVIYSAVSDATVWRNVGFYGLYLAK
jgi:hypothetical protein